MRIVFDEWINDIPGQFHEKKNIEVLIKAFSRQLQDLQQMFADLYEKTDLDVAAGQNLDYVGTVIPLTRKEAGELAGIGVEEPVISDERYRKYLQYRMLRNTCECTYYDIMRSIEILWDVDRASYYERPDRPATIFIGLPTADVGEDDPAEGRPDIIKPGGVGFIYTAQYGICIDQSDLESIVLKNVRFAINMPFFPFRAYNGVSYYDGSTRYDAKRKYNLGAMLRLHYRIREPENDICNLTVETRRNVQYYNGKKRYDGKTKYNALIRKDVIE